MIGIIEKSKAEVNMPVCTTISTNSSPEEKSPSSQDKSTFEEGSVLPEERMEELPEPVSARPSDSNSATTSTNSSPGEESPSSQEESAFPKSEEGGILPEGRKEEENDSTEPVSPSNIAFPSNEEGGDRENVPPDPVSTSNIVSSDTKSSTPTREEIFSSIKVIISIDPTTCHTVS